MNEYNNFFEQREIAGSFEKAGIRKIGLTVGACVLISIGLQNLMSLLLFIPVFRDVYYASPNFQSCFTIIASIIGIGVPFGIGGIYLGKQTRTEVFRFNTPQSRSLAVLAVPFGFFVCLIANYISGLIITVFSGAGIELSAPEYSLPSSFAGKILYGVSITVVPALVEELAIRGTVLQPLRKYGNTFAIVMSSFVFALLHGNLVQAPFAFIAGLAIGYAVCLTDSIWTGVAIHFVNNTYSFVTELLFDRITDEKTLNLIFTVMLFVLYAVSIIGSVCFVIARGKTRLPKRFTFLSGGRKAAAFILNVTMVAAILIMVKITSTYIGLE